ncbi:uroporphyrinogen-III C-methyltransferase [Donghicola eburneus]|jgi:uroporphyrin-III C-methyltransferase|uniref:uroporphyrinogen-III C-methyltransferase n=1 Tax=Donghicola eburneus TaxID=393278 RepID=A0A1M4MYG5_9RHOB|nr:uroporphyrinogen-III C-methyltransferase [Donghicola eburneus]MCI5038401.1 uroporphyrinogen-III C-methyltransferase [Donghicola eburneus]SCM67611.1 uroporphyrinogen-III C-methyltransferase-2 [Donghicola eburneus]SFQ08305.1 uroporphyrin-III C-methyltransferase [Donghicola eburneus]
MSGFVHFVSSGPGDPELLTLKAARLIKEADAILYDDLGAAPILEDLKPEAELVGVGKRAGRPSPKQEHVSQLLVDYASQGIKVVRLKSGDCGIFGRLEEETTALRAAGIPFDIVPGVTTASAAAAAANIPLTRRMTARRLQLVTGHDVTGALPEQLNLAALADPMATTAVYMGKRTFAKMVDRLISAGMPPETPAMLCEGVSKPEQELTRSTIRDLADSLEGADSTQPALILYGPLAD